MLTRLTRFTGKLLPVSPFKATSFLVGARQCISAKFAMLETKCTVAVLLSRFELKPTVDPWSHGYQSGLTTTVKGPLLVRVLPVAPSGEAVASSS